MAIFATYVYSGNVMSVSTTVLASLMIQRIKGPFNRLNNFYSKMLDLQVSMNRVHEFLASEESQPNVIFTQASSELAPERAPVALKIRGNYSFGFGGDT